MEGPLHEPLSLDNRRQGKTTVNLNKRNGEVHRLNIKWIFMLRNMVSVILFPEKED